MTFIGRNQLEERGVCVLEFTYDDVMKRFEDVLATISAALAGSATDVDPKACRVLPSSIATTQRRMSRSRYLRLRGLPARRLARSPSAAPTSYASPAGDCGAELAVVPN